jgi:serine/threonine protein kinase
MTSQHAPRTFGAYTVLGTLGQGGMGTVYLGRSELGGLVAIKVVRADVADDPQFRNRFRQEAAMARRVARVCTAEVLDFDPDAAQPYLVTEFIEGPTLSSFVDRRGPLVAANLEQLAVGVAAALRAIHTAGIVHRDLKPSNVVLSQVGPRVIDFGIARALDSVTESTGGPRPLGTPAFMAPEQIRGDAITSKADIWAWGGLMTFAATGQYPFGTGSAQALLYRAMNEEPQLEGIGPSLRPIVGEAMRKNPQDRPTASALMDRLLGDEGTGTDQEKQVTEVLAGWQASAPTSASVPVSLTVNGTDTSATAISVADEPGYASTHLPTERFDPAPIPTPGVPGQSSPTAPRGLPAWRRRLPLILGGVVAVIVVLAAVLPAVLRDDKSHSGSSSSDLSAFLPRSADPLSLKTMIFTQKLPGEPHYTIVSATSATANAPLTKVRTVAASQNDDLTMPAISSDRKTVFYLDNGITHNLMAVAADGSGTPVRLFTTGPASKLQIPDDVRPAPSPDGQLLVVRSISNQTGKTDPGVYIVAMDGSSVRRLNTLPQATDASWSPDGERIAYWSNFTGGAGGFLVTISVEPNAPAVALNKTEFQADGPTANVDSNPVWSPDGSRLAFTREIRGDSNNQQIFIMYVGSRSVTQITHDTETLDENPFWAANNDLLYTKNNPVTGDRQIFETNPNNPQAGEHQLTTGAGYHGEPRSLSS